MIFAISSFMRESEIIFNEWNWRVLLGWCLWIKLSLLIYSSPAAMSFWSNRAVLCRNRGEIGRHLISHYEITTFCVDSFRLIHRSESVKLLSYNEYTTYQKECNTYHTVYQCAMYGCGGGRIVNWSFFRVIVVDIKVTLLVGHKRDVNTIGRTRRGCYVYKRRTKIRNPAES